MSEVCPISSIRVNEKQARLNAFLVIASILAFLLTAQKWIIYFLILDFALRASNKGKFSPLAIVSKTILSLLKIETVMVDAQPKLFAATLGLIFCIIIAILQFMQINFFVIILSSILILLATLEACIGFCLGCKIYSLFYNR